MSFKSSRGGLEVELLLHKLHDSTSVGSHPARRQKNVSNAQKMIIKDCEL